MSVRKTKHGYKVDVRDAAGNRHRETFRTAKAAQAHERKMRDEREQGVLPRRGTDTLASFLEDWTAATYPTIRANTKTGYEGAIRNHILPIFGETSLRAIDQRLIQDWVSDLAEKGLSPRTIELNFAVLGSILKMAAEYGLCKPVSRAGRGKGGVRLPKKVKQRRTVATARQVLSLADMIDPRYRALILLAGFCGPRQSECFGLHPDAIDWDRHRIHVRRTVEHSGGALVDMTKNGQDRWVTMPAIAEAALAAHLQEWPHGEFVFHSSGKHLDSSRFHRDVWKAAREAAGLPDLWFHSLRHSAASIMAQAGWGPKRVQIELGHHSAAFTLDQYGHLFAEDSDAARETMNAALEQHLAVAKAKADEVTR